MTTRLGVDAANVGATAVAGQLNSGLLRIYSGSPPATADGSITTQVLLAEAALAATAFGSAAGGEITANTIAEVTCSSSGTAAWFRALRSNGTTVEFDGTVGTSAADCIVSSTDFHVNQALQITSLTFRFPLS